MTDLAPMPWEQGPLWKRAFWRVYFWVGSCIEDWERGGYCACRWYDTDSLHPSTVCLYHRKYAKDDSRVASRDKELNDA